MFDQGQKIGLAICSPHRKIRLPNGEEILDTVTVNWHRKRSALSLGTNINFVEYHADGLEVGVARDGVARRCLEHDPRPEYLFFLDDDVLPDFDAFTKLFFRLKTNPEYDIAAGVYCCKFANPPDPLIYRDFGEGAFWDWAVGDLLTTEEHGIKAVHMGLTLIRVNLFQKMLDVGVVNEQTPFFKTVEWSERVNGVMRGRKGTEDMWFCDLAQKVGAKIVIDTSVIAGHVDKARGITWGLPEDSPPVKRAKWLKDKDKEENLKLALDIGAGGTRRQWDGHKTYTTDIRLEAKPDYVQDTLLLNLSADHFDLVASSHHLEHLGRWDQEKAWQQIFKVCKPGGKIEHIVPNLEWAAEKIVSDGPDEHVLNVLYGAQELHGYRRTLNLHYFGYTPAIGKALAEAAGFVDVETEDWKTRADLHYNLIIRGRKPEPVAQEVSNGTVGQTLRR